MRVGSLYLAGSRVASGRNNRKKVGNLFGLAPSPNKTAPRLNHYNRRGSPANRILSLREGIAGDSRRQDPLTTQNKEALSSGEEKVISGIPNPNRWATFAPAGSSFLISSPSKLELACGGERPSSRDRLVGRVAKRLQAGVESSHAVYGALHGTSGTRPPENHGFVE